MPQLSCTPAERARKGVSLALQVLQQPGKAGAIAVCMGLSDATVSRLKNEKLEEVALLCAHLGIKWVPADSHTVSRETYDFLTRSHERVLKRAPELIWEDDEQ
jgi:hypothetical protein